MKENQTNRKGTLEIPVPQVGEDATKWSIRFNAFVAECERLDQEGVDLAERFKNDEGPLPASVQRLIAKQKHQNSKESGNRNPG